MKDLLLDELRNSPLFTPERLLKLACIADILFFPDYSLEILKFVTLNYGKDPQYNLANAIVESLAQFPNLVEEGLENLPIIQNIRDYVHGKTLELIKKN